MKFSTLSFVLMMVVAAGCGDSVTPGGDIDASLTIDASANQIDGSVNVPDAAVASADAANNPTIDGGGAVGVNCGDMTCTAGQVCCVTGGTGGGGVSQMCTASDACAGTPISCDGAEDCTGTDLCCGSFGPGGGGGGAACGDPNGGSCQIVLCNDPTDCPTGDMCCPSPIGGGNVCSSFGCGTP